MTIDEKVLAEFYHIITESKIEKYEHIASERTKHLTIVMENIQKDHNASAVLRTCDCFGVQNLHAIEKSVNYENKLTAIWCIKESLYKLFGIPGKSFKEHFFVIPFEISDLSTVSWIQHNQFKFKYFSNFIEFEGFTLAYTFPS